MNNKVVIVSGGSTGLGLSISRQLLSAGYSVCTFSRNSSVGSKALEQEFGQVGRYFWTSLDATDHDGLKNFVNSIQQNGEQIIGLVNNAGINLDRLLPVTTHEEIHKVISVNLEALLVLTRLVTRVMIQKNVGSIINMSSVIGHRGIKGTSVYGATKAGVVGFTKSLARELGARNIRVNAVLPGYIETDMTADMPLAKREQVIRRTPLARLGAVSDIANAVEFLLSDSSSFITGQTMVVDGGLTC